MKILHRKINGTQYMKAVIKRNFAEKCVPGERSEISNAPKGLGK